MPSVTFNTDNQIMAFEQQEPTQSLWYTRSELETIRTNDEHHGTQECRQNIMNSVLNLQQEQHDMELRDVKGLAKASQACSKQARRRAFESAERLAWEIKHPDTPFAKTRRAPVSMRRLSRSPNRKVLTAATA